MTPESRAELVALVERLMRVEETCEEAYDALVLEFESRVLHPGAFDLISNPHLHFGPGHEPTAEEVVDKALSYEPIRLPGPKRDDPPA